MAAAGRSRQRQRSSEPLQMNDAKRPSVFRAARAVLSKDLKLELRTFETLTATLIFTTAAFVVFHFALDRDELVYDLAAVLACVTILFASSLTITCMASNERAQG